MVWRNHKHWIYPVSVVIFLNNLEWAQIAEILILWFLLDFILMFEVNIGVTKPSGTNSAQKVSLVYLPITRFMNTMDSIFVQIRVLSGSLCLSVRVSMHRAKVLIVPVSSYSPHYCISCVLDDKLYIYNTSIFKIQTLRITCRLKKELPSISPEKNIF